jgi:predicted DNA-binding antitoxin AbrB/MazE fold protein
VRNTVEAIYEDGVFRTVVPITGLNEHERVRLVVEPVSLISEQRRQRIHIDPATAREIAESPENGLLES